MEVLESFPELKALGAKRLQELLNEWLATPKARECSVSEVAIDERNGKLHLNFAITSTHLASVPEFDADGLVFFPMDDLLCFLVDHGLARDDERKRIKDKIAEARMALGRSVLQHFKMKLGPKRPLFITCKTPTCGMELRTQYEVRPNENLRVQGTVQARCPRCGQTYSYSEADFHLETERQIALKVGDLVDLDGMQGEILELHPNGHPSKVKVLGLCIRQPGTHIHSLQCVVLGTKLIAKGNPHTIFELSDG